MVTQTMPLPMMVFLGVNIVLPAAEIIPVFPGKILTFLATIGMEICCMYSLLFA